MTNIYNTVATKTEEELDYVTWLRQIGAYDVFKPLFERFDSILTSVKVLRFIVFAYSPESIFLHEKGLRWEQIAKNICEHCDMPSDLYDEVYCLKDPEVQKAAIKWLWFQNDEAWQNYCCFRDLRQQMISYSLKEMASDGSDIKNKMDAAKYSRDLLDMMATVKNKFVDEAPELKITVEQLDKVAPKQRDTVGPQSFAS